MCVSVDVTFKIVCTIFHCAISRKTDVFASQGHGPHRRGRFGIDSADDEPRGDFTEASTLDCSRFRVEGRAVSNLGAVIDDESEMKADGVEYAVV